MQPIETKELLQLARQGDAAARSRLVQHHFRLVVHYAKVHFRPAAFLELDDLIQHGCLGLLRAIEKFDLERQDVSFVTYATYWIRHGIRRAIQNHGHTVAIPISVQRDLYALGNARAAQPCEIRTGDDQVSAMALGFSEGRWKAVVRAPREIVSFEVVSDDGEMIERRLPPLAGQRDNCGDGIETAESAGQVKSVLSGLPARERWVLEQLFGLSGESPVSTREVGQRLGISQQRVGQLRMQALKRCRTLVSEPSQAVTA